MLVYCDLMYFFSFYVLTIIVCIILLSKTFTPSPPRKAWPENIAGIVVEISAEMLLLLHCCAESVISFS